MARDTDNSVTADGKRAINDVKSGKMDFNTAEVKIPSTVSTRSGAGNLPKIKIGQDFAKNGGNF